MIGTTLSHYRIESRLGGGGMGEVFAAEDTTLERTVALKVLLAGVATDRERLERFEREAKAVAALNHPNIVTLYSVETAGEVRFLTMEYVDGKTLSEWLPAGGLDLERFFAVAIPLADALAAAHGRGIVHRDLKPGNVMMTRDGRVKVLDFGLAKLVAASDASPDLTAAPTATLESEPGLVIGTLGYMSPEQVRGAAVDQRSDVFSLGVLLYEMASGKRPFEAESTADVMSAILRDTPPSVDALHSQLPHHLGRIIRRCLEKAPERRYPSAKEVHNELDDLARELEAEKILEEHAPAAADPSPSRLRWWVMMTGVATVLLAGLIALELARQGGEAPGQAARARIQSLAVLPFDNLMQDPEQDFFVEGMHEALITDLSKIGALRVISRTSAMRYKGSRPALPEIARELAVDALVEGSVLRADGQVRITAQLIDGRTDEHLWAERYDRELGNVLALLSEVARAIAGEIEITVTPDQERRLVSTHSVDPRAHELYLRGQYSFNRGDVSGFRRALEFHRQATELDPDFAAAWGALSGSYVVNGFFNLAPPDEMIPRSRAAAQRALELDPGNAAAHVSLGYIALAFDWDWPTAQRELALAIELDPTNMMAYHAYADYLAVTGDCEASVEKVRRGRQYDPMGGWANTFVVAHLTLCGRHGEAIEEGRRAMEVGVEAVGLRNFVGLSLWLEGQHDEALAEWRDAFGAESHRVEALERGYGDSGPRGAMLAVAEAQVAAAESRPVNPFTVATCYAAAGDADAAFEWLETAFERRTPQLLHITMHPHLDPIRDDPRFHDLLRRIGILQAAG